MDTIPPNSTLHLLTSTGNAPSEVHLDAAYEGEFLSRASANASTTLVSDWSAEDPSELDWGRSVRHIEPIIVSGDVDVYAENERAMMVWN